MVDAARERAAELGLANVEFKVLGAEWIDLPVASVDAIICRFGFMLMADPEAALLESRRVLVSGGRIALAVWDIAERNPWIDIARRLLADRGLGETPAPGTPGPFVLADPERLGDLVAGAGFEDVDVQAVDLVQSTASFDDYWETQLDISPGIHATVMDQPAAEIAEIKSELRERMAPFTKPDGSLALPGRALLAAAGA
jgi:SAM-dependent methyltransferase